MKADGARQPTASVLVPTRARPDYLDVTLRSIVPQAQASGAEVIVISDGPDPRTADVANRYAARLVELPEPRSLNAARNAGVAAAQGELVVFVDDDVLAPEGWLEALLRGGRKTPEVDVFGGPIRPLLEGGGPRACGREPAPITSLDLGDADLDTDFVWGANMAIRRAALDRVGAFDETLSGRGDEEDWLRRYARAGGRVRYLAAAGLQHRRTAADARLRSLSRAACALGRTARRNDVRVGQAPPLWRELRVLSGCAWHTVRRRCGYGVVMFAHSAGRVGETLHPVAPSAQKEDFLSGASGGVIGLRAKARATVLDGALDAATLAGGHHRRLRAAALASPPRSVLVLSVERQNAPNVLAAARAELERTHHRVTFATGPVADAGKFENLNALLAGHPAVGHDWLLVVDDDVWLPADFLDEFVFLAERFDLRLAQPAHRRASHAAWNVTRRRAFSVVRETSFVEIGPVTAFHATTFDALLPFPALRYGWGLDAHWSAIAREHGWRLGVIDATPVQHGLRQVAAAYDRSAAIEEAREFLRDRPYVRAVDAQRTLVTHRSW